jgi:MFS transporter, MCT family, aspergillic acid transporter
VPSGHLLCSHPVSVAPAICLPKCDVHYGKRDLTADCECALQALSAVATWFHHKRGLAFGITMSGSSAGGVIFPIMINHLIPKVGFAWSMRIAAFMILGLLIIANLTVKTRTPPHPQPPMTLKEFFSPLTERTYALTAAGNFLFVFGLFIPINYLIVQAIAGGMSPSLANYLIPILNAARYVILLR